MKRWIIWGFLPLLLMWATSVAWLHYQAVQAEKASQNIKPADIAVILGNSVNRRGKPNPCLRSRVEAGVALYRQNKVSRLLMSGGTDGDGSNEAAAMQSMAIDMGIPPEHIRIENKSESTFENIALSAPLLQDVSNVIIVSDAFHLARAKWLVNRHLKDKNVQFYASDSCGDSTPNYLRKLSREIPAWIKAMIMHR